MKSNNYWQLFITFFKIGAFTFGGGYAMIALIQTEAVEKKHWVSDEEILDIVAIAESTPGPIAVNSATFIGNKVAGVRGSLCATLGVITPSFLIISILSLVIEHLNNEYVSYAFMGVRAGVIALMLLAIVRMYKKSTKDVFAYVIMILAFLAVAFFNVNAIIVIAASGIIGLAVMLLSFAAENNRKKKS